MSNLVFPIGHYMGERHPDGLHHVRIGLQHQTMTADEFDAWMRARRVTVATGEPGKPDSTTNSPSDGPAADQRRKFSVFAGRPFS